MKLNRIITVCAMTAALALSVSDVFAQAQDNGNGNNGGQNGNGGQRRNRQGGGPGGGGTFDPAAMQQRMVDGARDRLEFTNDTEWAAVEPLVAKVIAARFDTAGGRGGFGGRNRGGGQGGQGGGPGGGTQSPETEALQKAIDDNAPAAQIKDLLAKYKATQKTKQAKLEAAQADLRKVLNTKQEAEATLARLLD